VYEEEWSKIQFSGTALIPKSMLVSEDLMMKLTAGGIDFETVGLSKMLVNDPPAAMKAMADLEFINSQTFSLI
jgi:hypothetical protein